MDIGNAIKTLRKNKKMTQKKLAEKSGISVNALCQIEKGQAFPQKITIQNICEALQIPTAYLLFFCISEEDIPEEKRAVFNSLNSALKTVLLNEE